MKGKNKKRIIKKDSTACSKEGCKCTQYKSGNQGACETCGHSSQSHTG